MSVKQSNEITVKVKENLNSLYNRLENKGFKVIDEFYMEDTFFIPNNLNLEKMKTRDIIAKAILVRKIRGKGDKALANKLTFKRKNIDSNGNILSQDSINCDILDVEDAKKFIEAIGYKEIMTISEEDKVYEKDSFELAIKDIKNGDNLIEIETVEGNNELDTIEKLKEKINNLDIPIYTDNYFVKKAEIELDKVLKRKE